MKRFVLPVLCLIMSALLSGCGDAAAKEARDELSHRLTLSSELSFCADIRAEYKEYTYSFTVDYHRDNQGARVKIAAPENISGVTANVAENGVSIEYEGLRLDLGELNDGGLSPMSALPVLVDTLESGHLDTWWEENEMLALELVEDDGLSVTVWLGKASLTPLRAELICDGRVAVFCEISEWSIKNERSAKENLG